MRTVTSILVFLIIAFFGSMIYYAAALIIIIPLIIITIPFSIKKSIENNKIDKHYDDLIRKAYEEARKEGLY